jgi:L-aminopeptidase/D-esterase-like protein
VHVTGGGPATRETDLLDPLAATEEVQAVLLTGGSAFGLAAAEGVMRWLEERGRGHPTPAGVVPLVPAAAIFDLASGRPDVRPQAQAGYAACESAGEAVPERGCVGAGTGASVAKLLGRESALKAGLGYASMRLARGETVACIAAVNAFGDVIAEDGGVLAGPRSRDGKLLRTSVLLAELAEAPQAWSQRPQSTTLVCVFTDAALTKAGCGVVARMASAGIARAVDPVFTPVDGDACFCLAAGVPPAAPETNLLVGAAAATVTATAIRDAVRSATSLAGLPSLGDLQDGDPG